MCGIAGIYRFKTQRPVQESELIRMCELMHYRGPDGHGEFADGPVGLGHRRLSIIDTSDRSLQPMFSADNQVAICYNGEVYNYIELKEPLQQQGYEFRTTSDTEVLLQMYRQHGIDCLQYLNGIFAFAIWDSAKQRLFLARDHLGIKPLYYRLTDDGIVFASEIKAILAESPTRPDINLDMLDAYMSMGYCPGDDTMFKGIKKLPPGACMTIENGHVHIRQYWDMYFDRGEDKGEKYYVEQAEALFEDAVKLQLRSDVPLGVFLSGGIDSSAVVAMMRKLGVSDIKTFSVAWDYGDAFNETNYARQVAQQFETDHHEYFMSPDDFQGFVPEYVWHMDEPVTEAAAISLYFIAKKASEHITVVLSGEGSDEVFGGYPIYLYMQMVERYKSLPGFLRRGMLNPLLGLLGGKWNKYTNLSNLPLEQSYFGVSFYEEQQKLALYSDKLIQNSISTSKLLSAFYERTRNTDVQTKMQYLDVKTWLVDDLLIKADRMSMAASLELRVPFLDYRLLEFAGRLPSKYRLKKFETKYLIKKAMEPYLSRDILYRKKMGFPTPLAMLFKSHIQDYVRDVLGSDKFHQRGYFKSDVVNKLLNEHFAGQADHHRILWQLLVLEEWHRIFVDEGNRLEAKAA